MTLAQLARDAEVSERTFASIAYLAHDVSTPRAYERDYGKSSGYVPPPPLFVQQDAITELAERIRVVWEHEMFIRIRIAARAANAFLDAVNGPVDGLSDAERVLDFVRSSRCA